MFLMLVYTFSTAIFAPIHFHSPVMPPGHKGGGGGGPNRTEFPLSWQTLHVHHYHLHSRKWNTHRHTCIGAIAEDAGSRCDRIVLTVFLSVCCTCLPSSVCVTSECDLTCPWSDPEAAARLCDTGTISGLWLELSPWSVMEGTCHVISQVFNLLRANSI